MDEYVIGIHFNFLGAAREKIGDKVLQTPHPKSGLTIYPAIGDMVRIPGFESFTFLVVAREFRFEVSGLHIDYYLDSVAHEKKPPDLKIID